MVTAFALSMFDHLFRLHVTTDAGLTSGGIDE
jgi:hypothetical protein